jgi:hypothetical protein
MLKRKRWCPCVGNRELEATIGVRREWPVHALPLKVMPFGARAGMRRFFESLFAAGLLLAFSTACTSLPRVERGEPVVWPAPFQQRDHFLADGVHIFATAEDNAARGLRRYEQMLKDLKDGPGMDPPPPWESL